MKSFLNLKDFDFHLPELTDSAKTPGRPRPIQVNDP